MLVTPQQVGFPICVVLACLHIVSRVSLSLLVILRHAGPGGAVSTEAQVAREMLEALTQFFLVFNELRRSAAVCLKSDRLLLMSQCAFLHRRRIIVNILCFIIIAPFHHTLSFLSHSLFASLLSFFACSCPRCFLCSQWWQVCTSSDLRDSPAQSAHTLASSAASDWAHHR